MPKSLRDEAWLLRGGVGGGPKPGRANCSGLFGGAKCFGPFARRINDPWAILAGQDSGLDVTNPLAASVQWRPRKPPQATVRPESVPDA